MITYDIETLASQMDAECPQKRVRSMTNRESAEKYLEGMADWLIEHAIVSDGELRIPLRSLRDFITGKYNDPATGKQKRRIDWLLRQAPLWDVIEKGNKITGKRTSIRITDIGTLQRMADWLSKQENKGIGLSAYWAGLQGRKAEIEADAGAFPRYGCRIEWQKYDCDRLQECAADLLQDILAAPANAGKKMRDLLTLCKIHGI